MVYSCWGRGFTSFDSDLFTNGVRSGLVAHVNRCVSYPDTPGSGGMGLSRVQILHLAKQGGEGGDEEGGRQQAREHQGNQG